MRVFIAEKPSQGRAIAAILPGPQQKHKTHIVSGDANVVVWCAGHILMPYLPEDYDARYKQWRASDLPIVPDEWLLKVDKRRRDLYQTIKKYVSQATLIVHAGDPDREGQLLVDEVLEQCVIDAPVKRLLISDLNPAGVKRALGKLEDNQRYQGLRDAALGRSQADWLYGLNLTRLYTLRGSSQSGEGVLSVGRVQTPVLGLVVRRDAEIDQFTEQAYYTVDAAFATDSGSVTAHWEPNARTEADQDSEGRVLEREIAAGIAQAVSGQSGQVVSFTSTAKREAPPLPFSLPELQKAANRGKGLSAKQTLDIAQSLYEKHQIITYPRSDCRYLPVEHFNETGVVRSAISKSLGAEHALVPLIETVDLAHMGKSWNDSKVTAHHAIIPTTNWIPLERLTDRERWVYALIVHRYLLQFAKDREYRQGELRIDVALEAGIESFSARARHTTEPGWTAYKHILVAADENDQETPTAAWPGYLREGLTVSCQSAAVVDKTTRAPKRFTEATLLEAMTGIARYVSDPELKRILKDTDGLGTPATQASIIETLFKRDYVAKQGKSLHATARGRDLIASLPDFITLPDLTAQWESALSRIADGTASLEDFIGSVTETVAQHTSTVKTELPVDTAARRPTSKKTDAPVYACPAASCAGQLRKIKGPKGVFWGCTQYRAGCRETRPNQRARPSMQPATKKTVKVDKTPATVGSPCPQCGKGAIQLRAVKNGDNAGKRFLGCSQFPACRFFEWPTT